MNNDAQLIEMALDGNAAAFGQLVGRYQDRLFNTMVHVAGSVEDARDVVQDAFVQAFIKLESFKQASAFYTWLYRIAFNIAASRRRRQRITVSIDHVRDNVGLEPASTTDPPGARLEQQERAAQVQAALGRLSEDQRTVLVLREVEGHCYETIAEMLDVPVGTVRSRLFRARMQLREELKQVLQEDLS